MPDVLLLLMGASLYLAVHNLWVWLSNRSELMHLWIAAWCANSLLYQSSRYRQLTATTSDQLFAADRAAFGSAVLVVLMIIMMGRAVARVPRSRSFVSFLVLFNVLILVVHSTTQLFITSEISTFEDLFGHTIRFSAVGPLYLPFLLVVACATHAYGCTVFWRARHLTPTERWAFFLGITAYLGLGLNDIILYSGWIETTSLYEYGFAAVAVSLNLLMVHHINHLRSNLREQVTEHRRAREGLRRYEQIVSSSTDMLALLGESYTCLAANAAYLGAFEKTPDELIGHTVPEVFGEELFEKTVRTSAERCLAGEEVHCRAWFELPAHGRQFLDIAYFPYRGADGEISGFVASARNITDQKHAEDELEKHREHLEEMVEERTADLRKTINLMAGREVRMAELKQEVRRMEGEVRRAESEE